MKIQVINTFYLKSKDNSTDDLYALDIKFFEDDKIKTGDVFIDDENGSLSFKVNSLAIGSYNFNNDTFSIQIEKPSVFLENFKDLFFKKMT